MCYSKFSSAALVLCFYGFILFCEAHWVALLHEMCYINKCTFTFTFILLPCCFIVFITFFVLFCFQLGRAAVVAQRNAFGQCSSPTHTVVCQRTLRKLQLPAGLAYRQRCQIGLDFPAQSGNPGCSALARLGGNRVQSGNTAHRWSLLSSCSEAAGLSCHSRGFGSDSLSACKVPSPELLCRYNHTGRICTSLFCMCYISTVPLRRELFYLRSHMRGGWSCISRLAAAVMPPSKRSEFPGGSELMLGGKCSERSLKSEFRAEV